MNRIFARIFRRVKDIEANCVEWVICHPRTGWYVAAMVTVNVLLNILDLLH